MIPLPKIVTHPELIEQIIGQFAFMKVMAHPDDKNYKELVELDLNNVLGKADNYFCQFTVYEEAIDTIQCNLSQKIKDFLQEWKSITDITSIQQNIHSAFSKLK